MVRCAQPFRDAYQGLGQLMQEAEKEKESVVWMPVEEKAFRPHWLNMIKYQASRNKGAACLHCSRVAALGAKYAPDTGVNL